MNGSTETPAGASSVGSVGRALASNWGPLFTNRLFRALWLANLASDFGYWMNSVGASWTMTDLSISPLLNTCIQASTTLPMFLLALPAGAIADATDRAQLLYRVQAARGVFGLALAVLAISSWLNPYTLMLAVFLLGVANALDLPASQAALSEVVDPDDIPTVASLNNLSFNIGRALGPAAAGFLLGRMGAFPVFALNAVSAFGLAVVYRRWHRSGGHKTSVGGPLALGSRIREAVSRCLAAPRFRYLLARITIVYFCTNAFWCLFPIYARRQLGVGSTGFGVMMGSLGTGAVVAALALPRLKRTYALDRLIVVAAFVFAASLLALTAVSRPAAAAVVVLGLGVSYAMLVSLFNATAQAMFPPEIRARAISIYFICFYGVLAASSSIWGEIAEAWTMRASFRVAAGLLAVTALSLFLWPSAAPAPGTQSRGATGG
jgi:MFS family permease